MFKKILIATDGSKLSRKAIVSGTRIAASMGASVVGFHVRPPYPMVYYGEPVMVDVVPPATYERESKKTAGRYLAEVADLAAKAHVQAKLANVSDPSPADAIIKAARREKCDLIVMAAHGRRGIARLLLGSETNRVLTHSKIPVLVVR